VVFAPLLGRIPPDSLEAGTVALSLARLPGRRLNAHSRYEFRLHHDFSRANSTEVRRVLLRAVTYLTSASIALVLTGHQNAALRPNAVPWMLLGRSEAMSWIEPVKWLADKLMERAKDKKATARDRFDRVAAYFEELAKCLEGMLKKFKENKVPHAEGNQLDILINNFSSVVFSIYAKQNDEDSKRVQAMLSELVRTAKDALNEDDQMLASGQRERSTKISGPRRKEVLKDLRLRRSNFLENLERTIGRLRGLAAALRGRPTR
jgi:hypothetical protein